MSLFPASLICLKKLIYYGTEGVSLKHNDIVDLNTSFYTAAALNKSSKIKVREHEVNLF
jgi:hypothetical protein